MLNVLPHPSPELAEPTSEVRLRRALGALDPGLHHERTLQMPARQRDQMIALSSGDSDEPTLAMRRDRPTNPEGFVLRRAQNAAPVVQSEPRREQLSRESRAQSDVRWLLLGLLCGLAMAASVFTVLRVLGV